MRFVSTTDLLRPDWHFLAPVCDDPNIVWETFSGLPQNALERLIRRPALARWRAAWKAARSARHGNAILVSHLPMMAAATNLMRQLICPHVPQIAFAFNFTDLPCGWRLRFLRWAVKGIDEFIVFSRFEEALYSELLGIPRKCIRFLPWAMDPPQPGPKNPVADWAASPQGYLAAVGGEGRDYALLARAMRNLPNRRLAVVARPYSITGIDFPANIRVFTNLSGAATWRLAADANGMAIPLKSERTACGHITLIGTQLIGQPLVITDSLGVVDYVENGVTAQVVPVGDATALSQALERIGNDPTVDCMAEFARSRASINNTLTRWVDYFRDAASRFGKD